METNEYCLLLYMNDSIISVAISIVSYKILYNWKEKKTKKKFNVTGQLVWANYYDLNYLSKQISSICT